MLFGFLPAIASFVVSNVFLRFLWLGYRSVFVFENPSFIAAHHQRRPARLMAVAHDPV